MASQKTRFFHSIYTKSRLVNTKVFSAGAFNKSAITTAIALSFAFPAAAQSATANAQDLGSVLNQFATQANVEIMFSPELVSNRSTVANEFSGSPRNDLNKILVGTGLTYEEPSEDVFVIRKATNDATPNASNNLLDVEQRSINATNNSEAQSASSTSANNQINEDAPTGQINGQVLDALSGQPLAGAIIRIDGTDNVASTDVRGFYRFGAAPAGEYNITVSYLGNDSQTQRVKVTSGEGITQDFSLSNPVETVTVYGNRSSLQQALNQQRAASNSAAVVASDLLGTFPAETISEALRRVSGVTFARDDNTGEGDRVSVRGFNSSAINVQLNGIDLQGTGTDRSIDLSGFLTDNIKQVVIQKSLLPSQEANGSGGLVEIETRSGLDYGEKYFSVAAELENPVDSAYGDEFEFSTTGAIKLTDDFGMSATVQIRETDAQNYNVNQLQTVTPVLPEGFTSLFRVPESFNYPFDAAFDEPLYTGANYISRQREESNLTMSLNFAYDWGDHSRLRLDLQAIENDTDFSDARTTAGFLTSNLDMPVPELNNEVRRRTSIRSFRPTMGISDRTEKLSTRSISFRGETNLESWTFNYTLGLSKVEKERLANSVSLLSDQNAALGDLLDPSGLVFNPDDDAAMTPRLVDGAVRFEGDNIPVLALSEAGQAEFMNPENYYATFATYADAIDTTDAYVFELSARHHFDKGPFEYIEIGGKFDDRERNNSDDVLSTTNISSTRTYSRVAGTTANINTLNPNGFVSLNLGDIGLDQTNIASISPGSAAAFVNAIDDLTFDDPNTDANEAFFRLTDRTNLDPIEEAGAASPALIQEEILAAYIESKLILGDVEVIGGVRYQEETRVGRAISTPSIRLDLPGFRNEPRATFIEAGLIDFVDTSSVQETWTPSLIANYRPNEKVVIRGAYFRSTVHPSIDKIARPQQILLDLRPAFARATIREPNPDLQPSKTDNYDLDFSYYFDENPGLVRLGLFYKEISNNFSNTLVGDEETSAQVRDRVLATLAPLSAINPDLLALPDDAEFFINQPRNGEGGEIYGAEFEIIRQLDFFPDDWPEFIENFSILANATYTKSDFEDLEQARDDEGESITIALDRPLLRQSEWARNASIRYEDGPFSGSLIYTYQSESALGYDEFNLNSIIPEFDTLDLRMSYTFDATASRPQIIVFFEGDDILTSSEDADERRGIGSEFGDGNVDYFFPTIRQFNGGRRFTLGASVRF